jgi:hypothetical protein
LDYFGIRKMVKLDSSRGIDADLRESASDVNTNGDGGLRVKARVHSLCYK